jgi:hypothetical protein
VAVWYRLGQQFRAAGETLVVLHEATVVLPGASALYCLGRVVVLPGASDGDGTPINSNRFIALMAAIVLQVSWHLRYHNCVLPGAAVFSTCACWGL